jgi:hypothetical protein
MGLKKNKIGIVILCYENVRNYHHKKGINNFIYNKNLISNNGIDAHSRIVNTGLFGIYFTKKDK